VASCGTCGLGDWSRMMDEENRSENPKVRNCDRKGSVASTVESDSVRRYNVSLGFSCRDQSLIGQPSPTPRPTSGPVSRNYA
jgi:hypothetical protein